MVSAIGATPKANYIEAAIAQAAASAGVDFAYLVRQARVESGMNPEARSSTSTATGLYQFIEQSWLGTVVAHGSAAGIGWAAQSITRDAAGRYRIDDPHLRDAVLDLRKNPDAASRMAAFLASDNRAALESKLGHGVASVDLYLAHFLGAAGATRFLQGLDADPQQPAAALFPRAASSNRHVFFDSSGSARSLAEVRARFAGTFAGTFGGAPAVTEMASRDAPSPSSPPIAAPTPASPSRDAQTVRLAYLMLAALGV